jgi:hypothetical protein
LTFEIFSDLVSGGFLGATSIMGFYAAVAYLVGSTLRSIVVYKSDRIVCCDVPDASSIINLCDCVYTQRLEGNLKRYYLMFNLYDREEELFFVLMEVLRSPEMLK